MAVKLILITQIQIIFHISGKGFGNKQLSLPLLILYVIAFGHNETSKKNDCVAACYKAVYANE